MTQLLAFVSRPLAQDAAVARHLVARRAGPDPSVRLVHPAEHVLLAVASPSWDVDAASCVAEGGRYTVVAHASLYYLEELSRALVASRVAPPPAGASSAEWLRRALDAWGEDAANHVEGDFTFLAWDAHAARLLAARDHSGVRTLFHARCAGGVAVGTSLTTLRRVPGVDPSLNLAAITEDATNGDLADARETAYAAIARVPAGHRLQWRAEGEVRVERWFPVPQFEREAGALPFEEGAAHLRELLLRAVYERSDCDRGTAVSLSGGYDSTSVYAAGNAAFQRAGSHLRLGAVSMSHPPGDPGREDELILETTSRWGGSPVWVESEAIPEIGDLEDRVASRDEPLVHPYELWNAALASGARRAGARLVLSGIGGDAWFSGSPAFFADLFRRGQLLRLRREWREHLGRGDFYRFFKQAVQPNLSPRFLSGLARLRGGRALTPLINRRIPEWVRPDFVASSPRLQHRFQPPPRRPGEGHFAAEHVWYLTGAFPERVNALLGGIYGREETELRLPLLDRRIIEFASTRPRWESVSGRQNKHLLRRSMHGLLPEGVTAPRAHRTGLPSRYIERTVAAHVALGRETVAAGMLLADLGIVEPGRLLKEFDRFSRDETGTLDDDISLLYVLHVEWWLRAQAV